MNSVDLSHIQELLQVGKSTEVYKLISNPEIDTQLISEDKLVYSLIKLKIYQKMKSINRAFELINQLKEEIEKESTDSSNKLLYDYYYMVILLQKGKFEQAKHVLEEIRILNNVVTHHIDLVHGNTKLFYPLMNAKFYFDIANFDMADKAIKTAVTLNEVKFDPKNSELLYMCMFSINQEFGKFKENEIVIDKLRKFSADENSPYLKAEIFAIIVTYYFEQFDTINGEKVLDELFYLIDGLDSYELLYLYYYRKGSLYRFQGLISEAIDQFQQCLLIAERMDSDYYRGNSYNNIGIMYNKLGRINAALEANFKALEIHEEIELYESTDVFYNNIGTNFLIKGELDKALQFLERSREIAEIRGIESNRAAAYVNLGQTYHMKSDLKTAEKYYKMCYDIDKKANNVINLSEIVYNLLTLKIEAGEIDQAETYNEELQNLSKDNDTPIVKIRSQLGKAHILKLSNRALSKAKAQEILQDVIQQGPIDFELYASSILHLCDLLYLELKQTGNPEVLDEIKEYLDILIEHSMQQQNNQYLAESYLLQSKIALLELDMEKAKELIQQAENSIYDKGLDKLAIKISTYYDELFEKMSTMSELINKNAGLQERLEEIELEESFNRLLGNANEKFNLVEEHPSMFLILNRGSTSIYSIKFEESQVNEELIAGLLSALFTLSDEVFNTKATIQRIKHENYTIIMKSSEDLLFCYVFKGPSYKAVKKLEHLVQVITTSKTICDALCREISHLTSSEQQGMDNLVTLHLVE